MLKIHAIFRVSPLHI